MRDLVHIHQTAELAERVLLPGDPGRALRLAQVLLEAPKMHNHNRGLWGYTGKAADGLDLSIQSTGMGGPSAAIVTSELIELGARRLLRIGTCGGLAPGLELGQIILAAEAVADDGTSRALGEHPRFARVTAPGGALAGALAAHLPPAQVGSVVSTDLFYDADHLIEEWAATGALAVDMETATIFAVAARRGVEAGSALLISNLLGANLVSEAAHILSEPGYIDAESLHAAELRLGALAIAALSSGQAG